MNLHRIVRCVITSVHPDEHVMVYHSIGQKNVRGKITTVYSYPISVMAQIQPSADALRHTEDAGRTTNDAKGWFYADTSLPTIGIDRNLSRTGDFVQRSDGTWWLVTSVDQDYASDGWVAVTLTQQIDPPHLECEHV